MISLTQYITESFFKFKSLDDVQKYLDKFKDDETSWRGATDELRDIARESREILLDLDGIEVEAINFKALKTPSEWNTVAKNYIINNIKQMSKSTQNTFFKNLNDRF